jgi:hypothetical protein
MAITFKECGDCTICCDGWLTSNAYGNKFGNGISCKFLCDKNCSIYNTRPQTCSNYQCGWSQGLFPDWMKPTLSNVLISIEVDAMKKQFLKIIELGVDIKPNVLACIDYWTTKNNTYYIIIKGEK